MNLHLISYRILHPFLSVKHPFFVLWIVSIKERFFSRESIRLSTKSKRAIAVAFGVVLMISIMVFFPDRNQYLTVKPQNNDNPARINATENSSASEQQVNNVTIAGSVAPSLSPPPYITTYQPPFLPTLPPGLIGSTQVTNSTVWKKVAMNAWGYFQPDIGFINNVTGLPSAGSLWPFFTDWDLGVYIQAILDARRIGLIEKEGPWGVYDRVDKVLTFLENRKLTNESLPYWFYQAENGEPHPDFVSTNNYGYVSDAGRLLVALKNLKTYNNTYTTRIDNITKNRMNYSAMLKEIDSLTGSNNIYDYFVASGFAGFWPDKANVPASIMNNIWSTPQIDFKGVKLPTAKISCEPILLSIFDLQHPDSRVFNLSRRVYRAHEAWFNYSGKYRAFSEGPINSGFVYEWVVLPDGRTWIVQNQEGSDLDIVPIVYTKVAFSFLALHNTTFARDIVAFLEKNLLPPYIGYYVGISEDRENIETIGCNTNGLIISAARYAIQKCNPP